MNLVRLTFVVFLLLFTSCQKEEILQEEISLQEVQLRFEQIEKNTDFLITPQWETFEQGGRNEIGEIYAYVNVLVKEEFNAKLLITDVEGELQMSIVYSSKNKQSLLITDLQGKPKEYYRLTDKGLRMFLVYATPKARASIKECDDWSCMRSLCKSPICSCSCHPQKDYGTVVRPASSFIRNEDPETGEFMGGGVDYFLDEVIVFGERPINRYTPSFPNYNATRYPSFLPDFGFYPFKNGSLFDTEALKDLMSGSSGDNTPQTPCEKLSKIGKHTQVIEKMRELQTKTKENKEIGYILRSSSSEIVPHYIEGKVGEAKIEISLSGQIDGVIHSHYTGLLSVFSVSDIFALAAMYKNGNIRNVNSFVMGLVTDAETQYMMVIEDPEKFAKFANNLFNGDKIDKDIQDNYERVYQLIYKITPTNTPQLNENSFVNYLRITGSGLKLMKGDKNMSNWKVLEKGSNGNLIEKKCD